MQNSKKNIIFPLIFLALTAGFFILAEAVLRIAGAGYDTRPFVHPAGYEEVWTDNPQVYRKYVSRSLPANPDSVRPNIFDRVKKPGTLRGFVLGGSTAQGFPYLANQSFSKMAEAAAQSAGVPVEILNLGRSAMSSYYVRDMLGKLAEYEPDFLVIYAGHNEYYGTISETSGSSHVQRLLFLGLKELRIFQVLFDLLSPPPPPLKEGQTLMSRQFAQQTVPADQERDRLVARNFLENLEEGLKPYLARGIPVFVFSPVSNLEMPPFSSEAQETHRGALEDLFRRLKSGETMTELEGPSGLPKDRSAHLQYLEAWREQQVTGKWNGAKAVMAKDLDSTPFRGRSALVLGLKTWAEARENVVFIDTAGELEKRNLDLTRDIFIDHLHFNLKGQQTVGRILSEALGRRFTWSQTALEGINGFFDSRDRVVKGVYLTDYFQWRAINSVEKLSKAPPFSTMIFPPDFGLADQKRGNPLFDNPEVDSYLSGVSPEDQISRLLSFYAESGQNEVLLFNLTSLAHADRGNPQPAVLLADFYSRSPQADHRQKAGEFLLKAYLLSGRPAALYDRLMKTLGEGGQTEVQGWVKGKYPPLK